MKNPMTWIVVAIILLSVGSVTTTILISTHHGVADGYIPADAR